MATKKIVVILILSVFTWFNISKAQENTDKKLTRKEKKERKKELLEEKKQAILELLKSKQWVIEAHTVYDRYNQSYQINPTINFVSINNNQGSVQLGFNQLIGWNGVGGVTIDGMVTQYDLKVKNNKSNPNLSMRFSGKGVGSATIFVTVNASGQANAKVSGDFGHRITFQGYIVSLESSQIFKGQSLY